MFGFIKKLFGTKTVEVSAPYKVETPVVEKPAKVVAPKPVKKPIVKKATTRKPRAPKA